MFTRYMYIASVWCRWTHGAGLKTHTINKESSWAYQENAAVTTDHKLLVILAANSLCFYVLNFRH